MEAKDDAVQDSEDEIAAREAGIFIHGSQPAQIPGATPGQGSGQQVSELAVSSTPPLHPGKPFVIPAGL